MKFTIRTVILIIMMSFALSFATPSLAFISPTPDNATITTDTSIPINVSINESSLGNVTWNWNGTNYSIYDDSLVAMHNFDAYSIHTDYFNDSSLNTSYWTTSNSSCPAATEGSVLSFACAGGAGDHWTAVSSANFTVGEDYDFQISYSDYAPTGDLAWLHLSVTSGDGDGIVVFRSNFGAYAYYVYVDGVWVQNGIVGTSDTSGKLRIVKTNNTLSGFYYSNGRWVPLCSGTNEQYGNQSGYAQINFYTTNTYSTASVNVLNYSYVNLTKDASRYGNNAINNKTVWTSSGKYGGAMDFDGTTSYITAGNNLLGNTTSNYTVALWFKANEFRTSGDLDHTLFTQYASPGNGRMLFYIPNDGPFPHLTVYEGSGAGFANGSTSLSTGQWYHAVLVNDNKNVKVYLNGVEEINTTFIYDPLNAPNHIGAYVYSGSPTGQFNGSIDEVRIYNRSLSAEEIQIAYMSNLNKYDTDKWTFYINQSKNATDGLDNGTYTYQAFASDIATNSNQADQRYLAVGSDNITIEFVSPTEDNDTTLARSNIAVNVTSSPVFLQNITIYFYNSSNDLINTSNSTSSPAFANFTDMPDGLYYFNATVFTPSGTSNSTETRVVTIDATSPRVAFVFPTPVNGANISTIYPQINVSINDTHLNNVTWNWNGTNYSIYDNSLIAMYNFDNVSALGENDTYALDSSAYGNNGNFVGSPNYVDGKYGKALNFSGSNFVNGSSSSSLQATDAVTVMAWVYPINTPAIGSTFIISMPFSNVGWDSPWVGYGLGISSTSTIYYLQTGATYHDMLATTSISDNEWYQVVLSYNGSDMIGYVNGVQVISQPASGTILYSGTPSLAIGTRSVDDVAESYTGYIDEVRVYNRSLSAEEINQSYYSNLNKFDTDNWLFYVNETNLTEGTYTYQTFAKDLVNYTNETEVRTLTVDLTAPILTIESPSASIYNTSSIDLNYTVSDAITAVDTCWYSNDSGITNATLTGCSNITFSDFSNGNHTIIVWINDSANNVNTSNVTFTVDTLAPALALLTPANNHVTNVSSVELNFTANDTYSPPMNCSLYINGVYSDSNSSVVNDTTTNFTLTFAEGFYNWSIVCNDQANNTNTSETWNFTIDLTAPSISVLYPTEGLNLSSNVSIALNYTYSDATSGINLSSCTYSLDNAAGVSITDCLNTTFNVSTNTEGRHNISISLKDNASNSNTSQLVNFTIDLTAPLLTIQSPTATYYNTSILSLNYTVSDAITAVDSCWYSNDSGVTNATLTGCDNLTLVYADGSHTITLWATDSANNQNSSNVTFTVDTTPPTISLNYPIENYTTNISTLDLNFTTIDALSSTLNCSLYLNGALNQTNASVSNNTLTNFTLSFAEGHYNWSIVCKDNANNTNTSETRNFTIDLTPPTLTLDYPTNNLNLSSNVSIVLNYTYSDATSGINTSGCTYSLDGAAGVSITNCLNTTFNVSTNVEGRHNISVTVKDNASNSNTSELINFTIDLTAPLLTIQSPTATYYNTSTISLNYTVSDAITAVDSCWYSNNSGVTNATISGCSNISISGYSDGNHTITLWANDSANNQNSSNVTFTVDTTPPTISLNYPIENYTTNISTLDLNFTTTDALSSTLNCSLYLNGALNQTNASVSNNTLTNFTISFAEGHYNWSIVCLDTANNTNTSETRNFTIDLTAPTLTLDYPTNNLNLSSNVSIALNYTYSDATSGINTSGCTYSLDSTAGVSIANCLNTTFNVSTNVEGLHNLSVSVKDQAGNTNTTTPINFTIDLTAPSVSLNSPANNTWTNLTSVSFNFTATDNIFSTINCSLYLDGTLNRTNSSVTNDSETNFTVTGIADGNHSWYVNCKDGVNWSTNSSTRYVIVDTVAPSINLTSPASGYSTTATTIAFQFNVTDSLSPTTNCTLYLDGTARSNTSATNASTTEISLSGLSVGAHSWNVTCYDLANNSANSSTLSFTITSSSSSTSVDEGSGSSSSRSSLLVEFSSNQTITSITVSDSQSGLISGASVTIVDPSPTGTFMLTGTTDSYGFFSFDTNLACGLIVNINVQKSGYSSVLITRTLASCNELEVVPPIQNETIQTPSPDQVPESTIPIIAPENTTTPASDQLVVAQSSLDEANAAIQEAILEGKDVSAAQSRLSEARLAFESGDYALAMKKANEAKRLALAAEAKPIANVTTPISSIQNLPVQPPVAGFPWLLVLEIIVLLGLVAGGIYFYISRRKA